MGLVGGQGVGAVWGKLPDRHREWVLNDVTCRTWWLAAGTILALIYSVAYIEETGEHRLGKHGYPVGTGREMRARRGRRAADEEHYNATYRSDA